MTGRKYYNCYSHRINLHSARLGNEGVGCSRIREECYQKGGPDKCLRYQDAQMALRKL